MDEYVVLLLSLIAHDDHARHIFMKQLREVRLSAEVRDNFLWSENVTFSK